MLILHGRVVISPHTAAIPDGAVAVQGDLIAACGPYPQIRRSYPDARQMDLTDCALWPGLVNAHTHLELSALKNKVPYEGNFVGWVRRLTAARWAQQVDLHSTIVEACRESLRCGVTTVGDISYEPRTWQLLAQQHIRKSCFAEVFGMKADLSESLAKLENRIAQSHSDSLTRLGLSPHAPYSAGEQCYRRVWRLAKDHDLQLTTHLAENREEIEFLQTGAGPWLEYLVKLGKWDGSFGCPRETPVRYFLGLNLTEPAFLLAHVNYIDEAELGFLARSGHSVAYCPRSHDFFGHPPHSFARMLELDINVCLGTDSLASNHSLSILDEMRFLHNRYPDFPHQTLLQMATINGAAALGWSDTVGTLTVGKEADLIALPLGDSHSDPLADILQSDVKPKLTMVQGKIVYQQSE